LAYQVKFWQTLNVLECFGIFWIGFLIELKSFFSNEIKSKTYLIQGKAIDKA
jgi:hypothetical protein